MVAVVFSRIIFLFTGVRQLIRAKSPDLHGPLLLLLILSLPIQAQEKQPHILLVADPDMESPIFRHSVVLVAPQDNGSALGVILNRLIPFEPGSDYQGDELLRDAGPIHFGGPINPAILIFLFRADSMPEGSVHLFADVYFSSDRELLAELRILVHSDHPYWFNPITFSGTYRSSILVLFDHFYWISRISDRNPEWVIG